MSGFKRDPLYYHHTPEHYKVLKDSEAAYLVEVFDKDSLLTNRFWIPKKYVKEKDNKLYFWKNYEFEVLATREDNVKNWLK